VLDGGSNSPVPVLLVTGALGAGKTTLINALLKADHGLGLAAIVNDFGSINIDEAILSASGQPVYGLANGCICCSLQGDLLRTLRAILSVRSPDAIVIEASGVSDPRGIIETLCDPMLRASVVLDAVVAVVDAEDFDPASDLWIAQVWAADFVALSKIETASADNLVRVRSLLESMRKAHVFPADEVFGVPANILLGSWSSRGDVRQLDDGPRIRDDRFVRLEWSSPAPIPMHLFQSTIELLAPGLVRAKGYVSTTDRDQAYLFQLVGSRASLTPVTSPIGGVQLVLIGEAGVLDVQAARSGLGLMATQQDRRRGATTVERNADHGPHRRSTSAQEPNG